ncbi:hypothetical protein WA1_49195 [Scytonema hofmannii PCC 7110]|uniref:Bacterial conjugation TrbI-like protein n=1 Tax=Scytonema hofmannii PCC 7110 TaxID=128403 RepID=A0A139WQL0_9CYAN|nr:TrbI/VirB10 family protein [Scytonema hofmannii]KYC34719.1 hypothetical protein WA1_49195 [Scytonema hofmannii PCC 7110]
MSELRLEDESEEKNNKVNSLLKIDDNDEEELEGENNSDGEGDDNEITEVEEDPVTVQTKHSIIDSPFSRLGVVGGAFGAGFLMVFLMLNGVFNNQSTVKKDSIKTADSQEEKSVFQEEKDGNVYAKLALAKQQEELEKINKLKSEKPEKPKQEAVTQTPKPAATPTPPTPAAPRQVARYSEPPPPVRRRTRTTIVAAEPPAPVRQVRTTPRIVRPSPLVASQIPRQQTLPPSPQIRQQPVVASEPLKDPIAEIERLRGMGSVGRVEYASATFANSTSIISRRTTEGDGDNQESTPRIRLRTRTSPNVSPSVSPSIPTDDGNNGIEELKPKWDVPQTAVAVSNKQGSSTSADQNNVFYVSSVVESTPPLPQVYPDPASPPSAQETSVTYDYLPEEAQIIEGKQPQYLVVGSFVKATLVTPLVWSQEIRSTAQNSNKPQTRFVARLEEPLLSNTGEIGIQAGTLVAVEMVYVDGASRAFAEVTAIMKDQTEYPVPNGAITVAGLGGNPLIAKKFHDKGGEIARYDMTVGVMGGLAKVGEIINQPDIEDEIEDERSDGTIRRRTRRNNSKRSWQGAFLEGAFGELTEVVGKRAERSTNEILSRANIWIVPKDTPIVLKVDRSLKLP